MILSFEQQDHAKYPGLLPQVYNLRKKWLSVQLGQKKAGNACCDDLDTTFATNIISFAKSGDAVGSVRLLQTTGPHSLSEILTDFFDGDHPFRSPTLWEASYFSISNDLPIGGEGDTQLSVFQELLLGIIEKSINAGVLNCICILSSKSENLFRAAGLIGVEFLGRSTTRYGLDLCAAIFDCTDASVQNIRGLSDLKGNIWIDPLDTQEPVKDFEENAGSEMVRLLSEAMQGMSDAEIDEKLRQFFAEKLSAAKSPEDQEDVLALMRNLKDMIKHHR